MSQTLGLDIGKTKIANFGSTLNNDRNNRRYFLSDLHAWT